MEHGLAAVSSTLLESRHHFRHRLAIVVQDLDDAVLAWRRFEANEDAPNLFVGKVPRHFAGQKAISRHARTKRSTSAPSVSRPRLTRTTSRTWVSGQSIAFSTWLGFMLPLAHALPADTAMPPRSNRISCVVASTPGMR